MRNIDLMKLIDAYAQTHPVFLRDGSTRSEARAAVVAEVEKLQRDAARYQWLREYLPSDDTSCDEAIVAALTPEELDAAIDAAMENTNDKGN